MHTSHQSISLACIMATLIVSFESVANEDESVRVYIHVRISIHHFTHQNYMYYMKSQVNINWFIFNLIHLNRYICRIRLHIFILINSTFISTGWLYTMTNDDIRLNWKTYIL